MPGRILDEYDKEFARFVLAYSGEDDQLDTVIEDCARFDMSVKEYFIDNLVNNKYHTKEEAEQQVQKWSLEYEENNLPDDPTQGKPQMKAIEWKMALLIGFALKLLT